MANKITLKRSAVPGKAPLTTDLDLGELAINTADGKIYLKKNDGTESIVRVDDLSDDSLVDLGDIPSITGQAGKLLKVNGTADGFVWGDPAGTTVSWGDIAGTLSNQTDLQTALNAKADTSHTHVLANITDAGSIASQDASNVTITGGNIDVSSLQLLGGTGDQGTVTWNTDENTLDVIQNGTTLQLGQEVQYHVRNNSGATITNGTPVMATGTLGASGRITIAPMAGATPANAKYFLGIATEDILNDADGKVTEFGKVRNIDTTGTPVGETWLEGDVLWIDPVDPGQLTRVEPTAPALAMPVAFVINVHATTGTLFVRATHIDEHKFAHASDLNLLAPFFNGSIVESIDFHFTSDGTNVTGELQALGGGDLTLVFSTGTYTLDTTPATTVAVTPGTDTNPSHIYFYIPEPTKVLTAGTYWPEGVEYAPIATALVPSAAYIQAEGGGVYKLQYWTDHISASDNIGHLAHINYRLRQLPAAWHEGVGLTPTIVTQGAQADDIHIATTAGEVLQLHETDFPAFNTQTGSEVHIINHPVTPYQYVGNLNTCNIDISNNTISNNNFTTLVIWGVQSSTTGSCEMMVNLPSGFHTTQADAIADPQGYTNYSIPPEYTNTGFLIARLTLKYTSASSGTWEVIQNRDLRGLFPSVAASGAGGGATDLGTLTDVDLTTETTGQVLQYNGSAWVNSTANVSDFTNDAGYLTTETNDLTAAVTWANVPDANITSSSVTQHQGNISHDALADFVANEHIDWTVDNITNDIHVNNISSAAVTQHQGNLSITESQISDLQSYLTSVALNDVTDVTITTPTTGQVLKYNGTAWINDADTDTGLLNVVEDTTPQLGGDLDLNTYSLSDSTQDVVQLTDQWTKVGKSGALDNTNSGRTQFQIKAGNWTGAQSWHSTPMLQFERDWSGISGANNPQLIMSMQSFQDGVGTSNLNNAKHAWSLNTTHDSYNTNTSSIKNWFTSWVKYDHGFTTDGENYLQPLEYHYVPLVFQEGVVAFFVNNTNDTAAWSLADSGSVFKNINPSYATWNNVSSFQLAAQSTWNSICADNTYAQYGTMWKMVIYLHIPSWHDQATVTVTDCGPNNGSGSNWQFYTLMSETNPSWWDENTATVTMTRPASGAKRYIITYTAMDSYVSREFKEF